VYGIQTLRKIYFKFVKVQLLSQQSLQQSLSIPSGNNLNKQSSLSAVSKVASERLIAN
jgi:hypothetical protein